MYVSIYVLQFSTVVFNIFQIRQKCHQNTVLMNHKQKYPSRNERLLNRDPFQIYRRALVQYLKYAVIQFHK